ncbi:MAG: T9SS type A sorting domain-containing protein [Crocinitomicaceae bacterium]|nr:T9SS type A sorting domain-containing protein [Crocinitomicaceae bacterium]
MKKVLLSVALFSSLLSTANIAEDKKIEILHADSTEKVVFDVAMQDETTIFVQIYGIKDDLASISLITPRGQSLFYEFVETQTSNHTIDLQDIAPGSYYLKLNFEGEIRLKTIVIK